MSIISPSMGTSLSNILIVSPILKGKLKNIIIPAVILLISDHCANDATPTTAKTEETNKNIFMKIGWSIYKYFLTLISMFRTNIRDYGMFIALVVIFIVFGFMTGWIFLGPYNFTNLLNQTAYVAVLAVGMTLVIVTRQIDLSVGYIGAFLGAYVVVAVENQG